MSAAVAAVAAVDDRRRLLRREMHLCCLPLRRLRRTHRLLVLDSYRASSRAIPQQSPRDLTSRQEQRVRRARRAR